MARHIAAVFLILVILLFMVGCKNVVGDIVFDSGKLTSLVIWTQKIYLWGVGM